MTDEEKHAWCKERTGLCAGFISPSLYAAAEAAGYDMRWFVINKPIPKGFERGSLNGYDCLVPSAYTLDAGKTWQRGADLLRQINQPRKNRDERKCNFGIACMPGHNGKCTACAMDEK